MKKILILTIALFTLFSCSSDDEEITQDPIIGIWNLFAIDNNEVSDCLKQSTWVFNENGTATKQGYEETNRQCNSEPIENATWENLNNGSYRIIPTNSTTTDTVFSTTFSDNNNTLKVGDVTLKKQ